MEKKHNPYLEKYKNSGKTIVVIWEVKDNIKDYISYLIFNWINVENIWVWQDLSCLNKSLVSNIVIIDKSWPILSQNWNIVSLTTLWSLTWDIVQARKWVLSVIESVLSSWFDRVSLVWENDLEKELETLKWSWTMFINPDNTSFWLVDDFALFEMIYAENISNNDWKKRTESEKLEIFKNYYVLKIWECILWWYQVVDFEYNWVSWNMIQCLRCSKQWNWVWKKIMDEIKSKNKLPLFAYTKKTEFFTKMWFKKIEWELSPTWAELFVWNV